MTSPYEQLVEWAESYRCDVCSGRGELDDAEPGDISYREWTCEHCGGSGLKPMCEYVPPSPFELLPRNIKMYCPCCGGDRIGVFDSEGRSAFLFPAMVVKCIICKTRFEIEFKPI